MAEDFSTAEMVIPGTFIRVRADALIGAGGISTGNIGIVGFIIGMSAGKLAGHVMIQLEMARSG